jgi:hypothetical protein
MPPLVMDIFGEEAPVYVPDYDLGFDSDDSPFSSGSSSNYSMSTLSSSEITGKLLCSLFLRSLSSAPHGQLNFPMQPSVPPPKPGTVKRCFSRGNITRQFFTAKHAHVLIHSFRLLSLGERLCLLKRREHPTSLPCSAGSWPAANPISHDCPSVSRW